MTPIPLIIKETDWPDTDRTCWNDLFSKGDFFDEGPLAHLGEGSVRKLRQTYGQWLSFLLRSGHLNTAMPPWQRATKDNVAGFIADGQSRLAPRTIYGFLRDLHWLFTSMAPQEDWGWLERTYTKLGNECDLWSLKPRKATSARKIFAWAMNQMSSVDGRPGPIGVARAIAFRDGLMLAFLISVPLRVRTFTGLRLSRHLDFEGGQFVVRLEPGDVKDGRNHEYVLGEELTGPMRLYLDVYRQVLLSKGPSDFLWISGRGVPLSIDSFTSHLADLTAREFGEKFRSHAFREIAATSISFEAPEIANVIADLLGHASLTMSEKHYNRANGVKAATLHQGVLAKLRTKAGRHQR